MSKQIVNLTLSTGTLQGDVAEPGARHTLMPSNDEQQSFYQNASDMLSRDVPPPRSRDDRDDNNTIKHDYVNVPKSDVVLRARVEAANGKPHDYENLMAALAERNASKAAAPPSATLDDGGVYGNFSEFNR